MHAVKPLPFDASKLRGLSERLIVSHHENNYGGAVKNHQPHRGEAGARHQGHATPLLVAALKERELTVRELGHAARAVLRQSRGDGRPGGPVADARGARVRLLPLRWEELFALTGMGLAGGSGWAVLAWDFQRGEVRTYWSGIHTQACAFGSRCCCSTCTSTRTRSTTARRQPSTSTPFSRTSTGMKSTGVSKAPGGKPHDRPDRRNAGRATRGQVGYAKIEQLTGLKGQWNEKEGVFKVQVPRSDLSVTAAGAKLTPPLGLTAWAAFTKAGTHTVVMGDMVLTEDQVNPAMDAALQNGLEVTALHNHFLWETPASCSCTSAGWAMRRSSLPRWQGVRER